ncbi:hypothetical protein TNIN_406271 [Trichonephila inaurata madagascariensis]|uniref:Uncharacterized protein n=1 Tax=Trichonephila inaurata madagascariensis TaxID=2747483 RepID=A0A8X6WRH0_9ARAC|nr:hypothetical protein TNIN_406271 [Trichonephila inaurata madagascariensis]
MTTRMGNSMRRYFVAVRVKRLSLARTKSLLFSSVHSGSPGDFGYAAQPAFYDFFPGQPPPDGMAYHGVLGPGQNVPPPPTSMEQPLSAVVGPGPVNLGADAPYLTSHGDHLLSQRSSPDSVLSLASDAYGPPRSSSAGFPGGHPMSETPVW